MKHIESKNKNYVTTDYSIFKNLCGNRDIEKRRIQKAKRGFQLAGQQLLPVAVNEKMEIIEGQARVMACKELGIPVEYTIRKGSTVKDAILLNTTSTKWSIMDYVKSYAIQGNEDYKFLLNMIETHPLFSPTSIIILLTSQSSAGGAQAHIREGRFKMSIDEMLKAEKKIEFCYRFSTDLKRLKGMKYYWVYALGFCYDSPVIDNDVLKRKIMDFSFKLEPVSNVMMAIEQLEYIYNYHSHTDKVYISSLYKEFVDKKKRRVS